MCFKLSIPSSKRRTVPMAKFISAWGCNYSPALCDAINNMNEQQQKACRLDGGLAAIVGVPGSGKTHTMITLLARSVRDGLDPNKILAMTFTRAAANEMNDRLMGMGVHGARVGTIHSVCRQILIEDVPMYQKVQLDDKNRLGLELKKCLGGMGKRRKLPQRGINRGAIDAFIASCKAKGCAHVHGDPYYLNVRLFDALATEADTWAQACGLNTTQLISVYTDVEKRRANMCLHSFDDMLLWAWLALIAYPEVRQRWSSRWSLIIVDEAQDSGPIQWDIARLLTGLGSCILRLTGTPRSGAGGYIEADHTLHVPKSLKLASSLYVYGDSSQAIYSFRSASPELFVEFATSADVTLIPLSQNYRSTPEICKLGTDLVREKPWHLAGEIISASITGPQDDSRAIAAKPTVELFSTQAEEAAAAIVWVRELAEGSSEGLNSCAILSRTAMGLHMMEIECIRERIPYRKMCAGSFFDSKEIQDVLAYLRVACGMDNEGHNLRRTINTPFRYISRAYIESCEAAAATKGVALIDEMLDGIYQLSYRPRQALRAWVELLKNLNGMAAKAEAAVLQSTATPTANEIDATNVDRICVGPAHIIAKILDETDYIEHLRREEGLGQEDSRLAALGELQTIAAQFKSPIEFLEYVDNLRLVVRAGKRELARELKDGRPALTLATIHAAKGLEWTNVRIVDVVEGRFPHKKAKDADEELRLLYVGITRAKEGCVITSTGTAANTEGNKFIDLIQRILKTVTSD